MRQEDPQDLELAWRQVDPLSVDTGFVPRRVELERPDDDPTDLVGGRSGRASQRDTDPGIELVHPERLRDVVVRAPFERLDLLALLIATRQDHDRRRCLAADPSDEVEAVHVRQAEVEQDDVRPMALPRDHRRSAVARLHDPVAAVRQLATERPTCLVVVFDDEDRRSVRRRPDPAHAGAWAAGTIATAATGRSMSIASPPSSLRRAATRPPIASTMPRTTARPIPVPARDPPATPGTR